MIFRRWPHRVLLNPARTACPVSGCHSTNVTEFRVSWASDRVHLRCMDCGEVWTVPRDDSLSLPQVRKHQS